MPTEHPNQANKGRCSSSSRLQCLPKQQHTSVAVLFPENTTIRKHVITMTDPTFFFSKKKHRFSKIFIICLTKIRR